MMLNVLVRPKVSSSSESVFAKFAHWGAAGLFILAILDSSPIPTFGGTDILTIILAAGRHDLWYEYAATATVGSVIGAYITFHIARKAGSAYLDKRFKSRKAQKVLALFKKWATGTLAASSAIPLPTPTGMFFAAAGAMDYGLARFLTVVGLSRAVRYFGVAYVGAHYGRHFIRVLRHPTQYWGWLLLFIGLIAALVGAGIFISRRLEPAPAK
jgi:membrane protein YqaA with SNARE-associated domain